jgi:WhiB family transcriptional regulator, redox-sensing transcriptional regulator
MSDLRRFDTAYVNFLRKIHEAGRVPCEGRGNLFFPDDLPNPEARKLATKVAKRLCQECPILQECFTYAIESNQRHGIWAGTTPSER